MPAPSGSPSTRGSQGEAGTPSGRPSGDAPSQGEQGEQSDGQGDRRPQADSQGDRERSGDDGWETSNENPGSPETRPGDGAEGTDKPASGDSRDSELEQALEVFDGQILSERQAILARRNETAGQRPLPEMPEAGSAGKTEDAEGKSGSAPQGEPGLPAPPPKPPPKLPVPPDVADAQDDDVVCRQIREAAVAETDTELREAMWDEYRRCRERG